MPAVVPVSGKVTMDGEPLAHVIVTFRPMSSKDNPNPGRSSSALTDNDGRFSLAIGPKQTGATVGKNAVTIYTALTGDEPPGAGSKRKAKREKIPKQYNVESTLTFEVPRGGTAEANFALVR